MTKKSIHLLLVLLLALIASCGKQPGPQKRETRAVWMSRFEYAQGKTAKQAKAYIRDSFQKFAAAGFNTVLFQVRGQADAFYRSQYEPWSKMLSDMLGKDPGWDPLQFAISEAHASGLDLQAWINTFPAWKAEQAPPDTSLPLHPLLAHPEWVVCDSAGNPMKPKAGYITFSPGIPAVQKHIIRVVEDIVTHYDVDGIHFDYIRYPEQTRELGYSHDSLSIARFQSLKDNPGQFEWNIWQREQINNFVTQVYNRITARKPWVTVSAAVIGRHAGAGWTGYDAVLQDARRWMATGKIDQIYTMTYHRIGHPKLPFEESLRQWKSMDYLGRLIIPGIATYKVGKAYDWDEIWRQIEMVRRENFPGMVFFSANSVLKALSEIADDYYPAVSLPEAMAWKNVPTVKPHGLRVEIVEDGYIFTWEADSAVSRYVIYMGEDTSNPENIVAILPGIRGSFRLKHDNENVQPHFYLTAVNRAGLESETVAFAIEKNEK
ncbi:MAG TPA: hypothetical protein ENK44_04805 [Caldithrix abyssi]|uniref:Glycosyl hydrolase-like 10 domain-containing protein n=1 Tax=Caldithrix abyssi TaxID=187145 RepID=A0A7V4UCT1_CALAY|nr:hypothetical protein [Caldithrix abyssi]